MSSPVQLIHLEDTPQCAASLLEAAQTLGFVYITLEGSGIASSKIERMFEVVRTTCRNLVRMPMLTRHALACF